MRMLEFGLSQTTTSTIRRILAEVPVLEKAVIYGSRAKGNYRPGSDIDLTLFGSGLNLDMLGQIAARLDESPIPYQVDLSLFDQIENAGLREHIARFGRVFYVGFNSFYFLQDYASASEYIMAAAQMAGSPAYLATLGARLAYYGGQSRTALLFLEEMLEDAADPMMQQRLQMRHLALQRAVIIEDALEQFKHREGRTPDFSELVDAGYLDELPADPYGGDWVLLPNGRVFSTSKFVEMKQ